MHGRNVLVETLSDQSSYVTHFFFVIQEIAFYWFGKTKVDFIDKPYIHI